MTTANPREIEAAISEAFHSGKPNFVIRRLQAERAELLGNTEVVEEYLADADYMETFGNEAWKKALSRPPGPARVAFMRDAVAKAKGAK